MTNTRTRCLWWIKHCRYGLFNHLGSCWNIQFQISSRRKTGKETLKSSKLQLLEKILANKFTLTDAEDNTSGLLNKRNTADLSLLRILLAIQQKPWEPSFWEVMDSFVLVAYASLAASRTLLQWLLAYLNFTLYSEDLWCWCKQKCDFYELWQQHKLLKTIAMSEVWPNTYDEGYIN